ncbi:sulfate ABC transporter substrate-binding protein [uncultured Megasphaera sp.]|uniref:sulfate ABC transporter substrate-binding protein n=1 Tax=uncultured Megasphaera sp. TaxID=165188 RepID=UPI00265A665F|nr:sulfate ABC transporter substrate-binding protein [uncultured Megasphaera sp.]
MVKKSRYIALAVGAVLTAAVLLSGCGSSGEKQAASSGGKITLTNVSYDPTRELYEQYNPLFQKYYKEKTGKDIEIVQSHGGSGGQARSVIEGSKADVVTLALAHDITLIEKAGLIKSDWIKDFPKDSSPYTSTIVFLVRKGNPKQIKDWDDLAKPGVNVITPDPKSSGGACWNFLGAWAFGQKKFNNDEGKTKELLTNIYKNVSVMDSGARGATTTFVENGQGDVLIAWENEAINSVKEYPDKFEIVTPSISILAQPSVAIVTKNAQKNGTEEAAKEYLNYLYTDEAQKIIGENGYRPSNPDILKQFADKFNLNVNLVTINDFGGWDGAYEKFFNDGAIFDQIMTEVNK